MPNHVHVLAAFPTEEAMLEQCESWKRFTARQINRLLNRRGRFWQQDVFDHLVRSPEEFERLRAYIAENPIPRVFARTSFSITTKTEHRTLYSVLFTLRVKNESVPLRSA